MKVDLTKDEINIISEVLEDEIESLSEHEDAIFVIQQKLIAVRDYVSIDELIETYTTDEKFTYHEACKIAGKFIRCLLPDFPEDYWYSIGKYWDLQITNDEDGKRAILYPVIWNERRKGHTNIKMMSTIFQED
jgi:hypothetical protein